MPTFSHTFNENLFADKKSAEISCLSVNKNDAFYLGFAFGVYLNKKRSFSKKFFSMLVGDRPKVAIGIDKFPFSTLIKERFIQGLIACGVDIIEIGPSPSPVLFYSLKHFGCEASALITTHSTTSSFSNIKFSIKSGLVDIEEIQELCEKIEAGISLTNIKKGVVNEIEILETYIIQTLNHLKFNPEKRLRIGVYFSTNCIEDAVIKLLRKLPFFFIFRTFEGFTEGKECILEEKQEFLEQLISEEELDVVFILDAKGKRLTGLTKQGKVLKNDELVFLLTKNIASKWETIILNLNSSLEIEKILKSRGLKVIFSTQSYLKMKELKAEIGEDKNGNLYLRNDFYFYSDALLCIVKLLSILSFQEKNIDGLLNEIPFTFKTQEIKIKTPYSKEKLFEIKNFLLNSLNAQEIIEEEDALRIVFEKEQALISCTTIVENELTFKAEAKNIDVFLKIEKLFEEMREKILEV